MYRCKDKGYFGKAISVGGSPYQVDDAGYLSPEPAGEHAQIFAEWGNLFENVPAPAKPAPPPQAELVAEAPPRRRKRRKPD